MVGYLASPLACLYSRCKCFAEVEEAAAALILLSASEEVEEEAAAVAVLLSSWGVYWIARARSLRQDGCI